ncbi:MAG: patatin-like phospholipase family protein [Acidobacteria bacterium]|nr:patatin-like phospholipase family protein [Acidobacteriota bacterium]
MTRQSVGLAMAGGGVSGAIYEIGALKALSDGLDGVDFNALNVYVGVSAGSFLASCLANGISPDQLCRTLVRSEPGEPEFRPEVFHAPAVGQFVKRGLMLPRLITEGVFDYLENLGMQSFTGAMSRVLRALPSGLYTNEPLRKYLESIFQRPGRTNDFRMLERELFIVAADLDSGEAVVFGDNANSHVPISRAVQCSTALPGLYPPVQIDGRYYVDGVLLKTMHASVALQRGAKLLFCINPIVPINTAKAAEIGVMKRGKLVDRGLIPIISQSLRTLIHSRLTVGVAAYDTKYDDADVVLFEPSRDDYKMFFTNVFSFSSRKAICEHAYHATLKSLRDRRDILEPVLAEHGVSYRDHIVNQPKRDLWHELGVSDRPGSEATLRLESALRELERQLDAMKNNERSFTGTSV